MAAAKKFWFRFLNSGSGPTIEILDDIGGWGLTAKEFANEFKRIGKTENVHLYINSNGGSITDGNEIINVLKRHKGEIEVSIGSKAASMATAIAMQGDMIRMASNGIFVIHNPFVCTVGDSAEHRKMADVMDKIKANIVADYVTQTGLSSEEVSAMMDEETWMDAAEALDKGFIDEIGEEAAEPALVTAFAADKFRNAITFFDSHKPAPEGAPAESGNAPVPPMPKKPAAQKPLVTTPQNSIAMDKTPAELAAEKAAQDKAINDGVNAQLAALETRNKEIDAAVAMIAKRDKRDVSEIANAIKGDRAKTLGDFRDAVQSAPDFKPAKEVVGSGPENFGSGIQVIEPIDRFRGTAGYNFVMSKQGQDAFGQWNARGRHHFTLTLAVPGEFRMATQTSTSPHTLTSIEYRPGVAQLGLRKLRVKQIIPGGVTTQTTLRGRREDAFTDDAATVAETGALANVAVSVEEVDYPVKDVGGYIEFSENLMADYPAVMSLINQRLPYKVERITDYQLLNGGGTGSDLTGILSTSGIQTQALAADTRADSIHKAMTKVQSVPNGVQANAGGGYDPDAIIIHPTDWETLELAKDTTGQYFAGGPFRGSYGVGEFTNVRTYWGLPAIITTAIAQGTVLVGAFMECAQWFQRQGIVIEMTNSNGTNFVNRIVTARAAERIALTVDLPNGFCQCTGF